MDDENAGAARGGEHIRAWLHSGLETRDIVAKRGTESAGLQEVPLHIDDNERRSAGVDGNRRRLCFYRSHWHRSLPLTGYLAAIG
jgi:hypothetical protein